MKYKEFMIESLTNLLKDNETLMHPIYGLLYQGNNQYYGFFGFTEHSFLIALISASGKTITDTIRVPLDIKSIKIKQNPIFRNYTIDISFNEGVPCKISAFVNVLTIDTQKNNLPLFLNFLKDHSPNKAINNFKDVDGIKVRWQIFSVFIYYMLPFLPMVLISFSIASLKVGDFSWVVIGESVLAWLLLLSPLFALAVMNRFLFGKILCVLNEQGLYLENDFITWENIKKIDYHPELMSRRKLSFTYASFTVMDKKGNEYQLDIVHFPIYGLKNIKKYAPHITIETPTTKKIFIIFMLLLPSIIGLIMSLF